MTGRPKDATASASFAQFTLSTSHQIARGYVRDFNRCTLPRVNTYINTSSIILTLQSPTAPLDHFLMSPFFHCAHSFSALRLLAIVKSNVISPHSGETLPFIPLFSKYTLF